MRSKNTRKKNVSKQEQNQGYQTFNLNWVQN